MDRRRAYYIRNQEKVNNRRLCARIASRATELGDDMDRLVQGANDTRQRLNVHLDLPNIRFSAALLGYIRNIYSIAELAYPQNILHAGITQAFGIQPPRPLVRTNPLLRDFEAHSVLAQRLLAYIFRIGMLLLQE
ncbi:hypothetical protein [Parasitella parasitica]|uniref:Uncharacterized protein n=1 Tax=Parasitella parasitica TaxID=35722 RepID=A0A0B7N1A9_9FUNG|nr:hypothetical protein [Parasitella parasitica]